MISRKVTAGLGVEPEAADYKQTPAGGDGSAPSDLGGALFSVRRSAVRPEGSPGRLTAISYESAVDPFRQQTRNEGRTEWTKP